MTLDKYHGQIWQRKGIKVLWLNVTMLIIIEISLIFQMLELKTDFQRKQSKENVRCIGGIIFYLQNQIKLYADDIS